MKYIIISFVFDPFRFTFLSSALSALLCIIPGLRKGVFLTVLGSSCILPRWSGLAFDYLGRLEEQ